MDHDAHDPSRNVPHFWRHEHTTFSGFINARERLHMVGGGGGIRWEKKQKTGEDQRKTDRDILKKLTKRKTTKNKSRERIQEAK